MLVKCHVIWFQMKEKNGENEKNTEMNERNYSDGVVDNFTRN